MKSYLTKLIKFYIKDLGSLFIVCSPEFSLFFLYSTPDLQLVPKKKFISFRLTILTGPTRVMDSHLISAACALPFARDGELNEDSPLPTLLLGQAVDGYQPAVRSWLRRCW